MVKAKLFKVEAIYGTLSTTMLVPEWNGLKKNSW